MVSHWMALTLLQGTRSECREITAMFAADGNASVALVRVGCPFATSATAMRRVEPWKIATEHLGQVPIVVFAGIRMQQRIIHDWPFAA